MGKTTVAATSRTDGIKAFPESRVGVALPIFAAIHLIALLVQCTMATFEMRNIPSGEVQDKVSNDLGAASQPDVSVYDDEDGTNFDETSTISVEPKKALHVHSSQVLQVKVNDAKVHSNWQGASVPFHRFHSIGSTCMIEWNSDSMYPW